MLSHKLSVRSRNLNLLKFAASVLVIYHHSFTVCGRDIPNIFFDLLDTNLDFGGLAVAVFFSISGIYVTKSLSEKGTGRQYFKTRFIRIYPVFTAVILISAFVMGPLITELSLGEYFSSPLTYRYLLYLFMIPVYDLPGVFAANPSSVVNGSLWSLILECICYIMLFILFKLRFIGKRYGGGVLFAVIACLTVIAAVSFDLGMLSALTGYARPALCFCSGMVLYVFREKIPLDRRLGLGSLAAFILLCLVGFANTGSVIFIPYLVCVIAYGKFQCGKFPADLGNYSYSIYLSAFPLQQIAYQYSLGRTPLLNTAVSALMSFAVSLILFNFIDKPFSELLRAKPAADK